MLEEMNKKHSDTRAAQPEKPFGHEKPQRATRRIFTQNDTHCRMFQEKNPF
jgi:hypothetical protein